MTKRTLIWTWHILTCRLATKWPRPTPTSSLGVFFSTSINFAASTFPWWTMVSRWKNTTSKVAAQQKTTTVKRNKYQTNKQKTYKQLIKIHTKTPWKNFLFFSESWREHGPWNGWALRKRESEHKKKYQQVLSTLRSINREDKFFEKNKLKHFVWGGSVKGDPLRQAGTSSKTIANCFVWWMTSGEGQSWYLGKVDSASNVPVAGGIHAWFHWSLPRFNSSIRLYPEPIMPQLPTWVGTSTPNQKLELQTASPKKKSNQPGCPKAVVSIGVCRKTVFSRFPYKGGFHPYHPTYPPRFPHKRSSHQIHRLHRIDRRMSLR